MNAIKNSNTKFNVLQKVEFLVRLTNNEDSEKLISGLTALQLKELRNFLEDQFLHLSSNNGNSLKKEQIKSKYEPIPDYYYSYDCRESLDSCYNETCLASNPNCFSRKIKGQIKVLLEMLNPYIKSDKKLELEVENS